MYDYLQVGKIVNTHGVKGEVKLLPLTDDISRFDDLERVFVESDGTMTRYDIQSVKYFKGMVIIKLAGIDDPETAAALKGCFALVDRENAVKLPEDTYFIC
ncbi:MAG TPA: ribosome maturation factor RimM, partial [Clostridiales bacterium]|nr:ribosome maturation factor RimM [Clostridiales bacterium]